MYILDKDIKLQDYAYSQRKYLPFEIKVELTKQRIREWAEHWQSDVYISFSGGLDSTVLLHLVRKVLGNDIPAVFVDTGLEYPEIKEFVKTFDNVVILRPKMPFTKVIEKYGYPVISKETALKVRKLRHGNLCERYRSYLLNGDHRGKLGKLADKWKFLINADFNTSEQCCDVMKKRPLKSYHKETGRYPYLGITQDESTMRQRQYEKTGCNVYDADMPKSQPMGFWTHQDVLRYAVEKELDICSIYGEIVGEPNRKELYPIELPLKCILQEKDGKLITEFKTTGEQRTGCIYCCFGVHMESRPNRFDRLKTMHPELYNYCMNGGCYKDGLWIPHNGLGMRKVLCDINVMDEYEDMQMCMF